MILEGIITTRDTQGETNVAPMGPIVDESMSTLHLRPFKTSQTYRNLKQVPYGVFHVVDDVLLIARSVIGLSNEMPASFPAEKVPGVVLADACRWYEFEIERFDDSEDRAQAWARVLHAGRLRDFFGFNRAKHAVVEAAILATRVHIIPREQILSQFALLATAVQKTAGPRESEAFALLDRYIHRELATSERVTVTTGARLHFGFFQHRPHESQGAMLETGNYGGVGLMIDRPGFVVTARRDDADRVDCTASPSVELPPAAIETTRNRVTELVSLYRRIAPPDRQPPLCRISLQQIIEPHRGLGSGTQLGMAVAKSLSVLAGDSDVDAKTLAQRASRGRRSALGVHGFALGGFLVDGGKHSGESLSSLVARIEIPAAWHFLLVAPPDAPNNSAGGLSGQAEIDALQRLPAMPVRVTERLSRLVLLEMLPALSDSDADRFAAALHEFGHTVGEYFRPVQGGTYASPAMAGLAEWLNGQGIQGVAQTSWGPTIAVCCSDQASAESLRARIQSDDRWSRCEVGLAAPLNRGAIVMF